MITEFLENLGIAEWIADAIADSLALVPFLFVVFVLIELFEFYFADKVKSFIKYAQKGGPLVGSLISIIPQCGFSVIASTLYIRKYLTRGTLVAIYLATSDEALPVLLANPHQYKFILPIILIKIGVSVPVGYLIDFILKPKIREAAPTTEQAEQTDATDMKEEPHIKDGCCRHDVLATDKAQLFIHPIKHTFNIFVFILVITLILNGLIDETKISNLYQNGFNFYTIIQPIVTAVIGLIPNCAVSLAITMMLIKGSITFGSAMSGLMSNAGLGLLVLLRANSQKDNVKIIGILLAVSILCGEILQIIIR